MRSRLLAARNIFKATRLLRRSSRAGSSRSAGGSAACASAASSSSSACSWRRRSSGTGRASSSPRWARASSSSRRRPALHSTAERLALARRRRAARGSTSSPTATRARSRSAAARGPSGIALTQGLVTLLSPAELEGVLAHELAHARHRDSLVQTPVVLLAGWLVEASRIGGFLERALLFVLGPVAASIVQVFLSPKRELAADARAAAICGSPHPLADALVRIEQARSSSASRRARSRSRSTSSTRSSRSGSPRCSPRIRPSASASQRLRALDPEWRDRLRAA